MNTNQAVQAAEVLGKIMSIADGQALKVSLEEVNSALEGAIHVEPQQEEQNFVQQFFSLFSPQACGTEKPQAMLETQLDEETAKTIVGMFWPAEEVANGLQHQNRTTSIVVEKIGDCVQFPDDICNQLIQLKKEGDPKKGVVNNKEWGFIGSIGLYWNNNLSKSFALDVNKAVHGEVDRLKLLDKIDNPDETLPEKLDAVKQIQAIEESLKSKSVQTESKTRHATNSQNLADLLVEAQYSKTLISTMTERFKSLEGGDEARQSRSLSIDL